MNLSTLDIITFVGFLAVVVGISLYASRKEETSEDYFLAGRKLSWWLIGLSLLASNISTEHFVGMAGKGFELGLAIASYEWMAAITLVLVALVFLPRFLKAGIYTIPEYLQYRYHSSTRSIMAILMLFAYVFIALASVLYSGALALQSIFEIELITGIVLIGVIAGVYTIYGGLTAVVWSDLIQGIALLIGGTIITVICFQQIGGVDAFLAKASVQSKLHTVLPWNHPDMPWVAVFIGGLWIPNIFYWGLNQFITQRTLAAKNIEEGQKGILFAAFLKLFIPFIIIFPGIIAFEIYGDAIAKGDGAYPYLIRHLLPAGLRGLMFAALFGAVMSSLDSVLNSASTIFTMDIFKPYFAKKEISQKQLVRIGRITTAALVVIGCVWAPVLSEFKSIFDYIQKVWGFLSPGIVTVFVVGIVWQKVPYKAANIALLASIVIYGVLLYFFPQVAFLHHMAITFVLLLAIVAIYTLASPQLTPAEFPKQGDFVYQGASPLVKGLSVAVVIATVILYVIFF